ncbi:unnamed protein product, partial [Dicrocoelium dendriticum]
MANLMTSCAPRLLSSQIAPLMQPDQLFFLQGMQNLGPNDKTFSCVGLSTILERLNTYRSGLLEKFSRSTWLFSELSNFFLFCAPLCFLTCSTCASKGLRNSSAKPMTACIRCEMNLSSSDNF